MNVTKTGVRFGILLCAAAAAAVGPGTDSLRAQTGMAQQGAGMPLAGPPGGSVEWEPAADTVELRGRLMDAGSGEPLGNAVVRLPDLDRYTLSASDGRFSFPDVPAGSHDLVVSRIGYGEQTFSVDVQPGSDHVLELSSQPIELEGIEVTNWERTIELMDRGARRRALYAGRDVFWSSWDRDDIVESGIDDPIEFMTDGPPRVVLRSCVGGARPGDRLCVGVPYGGKYFGGGGIGRTDGRLGRAGVNPFTGPSTTLAVVYLDGRRVRWVEDLNEISMEDIYRVESFGDRGERGIHLYTAGYLRLVGEGLLNPVADEVPPALFELPTSRPDTLDRDIPADH